MIELLVSDPVILFFSALGLTVTAFSIVRDTRTQRAHAVEEEFVEAEAA